MSYNKIFVVIAMTLTLFGYVNCGEMKALGTGNVDLGSTAEIPKTEYPIGVEKIIFSESLPTNLAKDKVLTFYSNGDLFKSAVRNVYWDHQLNLTQYCTEIEVADPWTLQLNCSEAGTLDLFFIVEYESGVDELFQASVTLLEQEEELPEEPENPSEPQPLNGELLYSVSCAGCHGAGATSPKRGRSASQIQSAINSNTGNMGSLSTLSADEIAAISQYLNQ